MGGGGGKKLQKKGERGKASCLRGCIRLTEDKQRWGSQKGKKEEEQKTNIQNMPERGSAKDTDKKN